MLKRRNDELKTIKEPKKQEQFGRPVSDTKRNKYVIICVHSKLASEFFSPPINPKKSS